MNTTSLANKMANNFTRSKYPDKQEVFVDPVTIAICIQIITAIITLIKECYTAKTGSEIQEIAYKQPAYEMRIMKRAIRRQVGLWDWWWNGNHYINAVLQTGIETPPSEIESAIQ